VTETESNKLDHQICRNTGISICNASILPSHVHGFVDVTGRIPKGVGKKKEEKKGSFKYSSQVSTVSMPKAKT
jgi:REP element-mobilizing transposase RayT